MSQLLFEKVDHCFQLVDHPSIKCGGSLQELSIHGLHKELGQIESPIAKELYLLAKASRLLHLSIGEYVVLEKAAADMTGHFGLDVLLGRCLAENLSFIQGLRRLIRNIAEGQSTDGFFVGEDPKTA
jgi:hypothetical protein